MDYKLILLNSISGVETFGVWTLELPALIGRGPDHDVCINHNSISRTHCRLSLNGEGALVVRDLDSTNGTYVDDKRVTHSLLTPGDTLQIGSVALRIEYASDTDHAEIHKEPETYDLSSSVPDLSPSATDLSPTVPMRLKNLSAEKEEPTPKKWWQFW